jgi:hypothetical protein
VGSLNWLAHTTRPDLSTVVSLLAQHQSLPSPGHLAAAHYAARYIATTRNLGIYFTSLRSPILESFLHFPLQSPLLSMSDANWGPQDATQTKSKHELLPIISRSMSAFYIDLLGPLHWMSKRQTVTAGSSAEAEIYAMDECVKFLLEIVQPFEFLHIKDIFMPTTSIIYNDNQACINWSKQTTMKGLRHIQMKENRVRENISSNFVQIHHVNGKVSEFSRSLHKRNEGYKPLRRTMRYHDAIQTLSSFIIPDITHLRGVLAYFSNFTMSCLSLAS